MQPNRRHLMQVFALGLTSGMTTRLWANELTGYNVAAATEFLSTIPRKTGDPVVFTYALDKSPIKATTGGWARDVTVKELPIATGIAGAHLFINAGGAREMHWHDSVEWGYIAGGNCQVTVVDPHGETEVVNLNPGDLWHFPRGHAHSVQTLGEKPCHAILAFNDGLYSDHGTFGISDWMSRYEPAVLSKVLGVSQEIIAQQPLGETYIMQGPVLALDGPQARKARPLAPEKTHRYPLIASTPLVQNAGGELYLATRKEFPLAQEFSSLLLRLNAGAMQEPHWHPNANEWHYILKGKVRITLFSPDKRVAVADIGAGDIAYIPSNCGHSILNIGNETAEILGALDSGDYQISNLPDWLSNAPRHLVANNMGISELALPEFPKGQHIVAGVAR
ncbi:cupin domain-containing protein [Ventosimonas gracilis]|nr:cupin domain-containing protein [Ventosimonas gracilis]